MSPVTRSSSLCILLLSLGTWGCGDPSEFPALETCAVPQSNALKISAHETSFVPLTDDSEIEVTQGFQGGYHVYAALRLPVQPANPVLMSLNLCQGEKVVARNRVDSDFVMADTGFMSSRHLIYVLHDYRAGQLEDVPSRIAARLRDANGKIWETSIDVTTRCCQGAQ